TDKKRDIHEADLRHLQRTVEVYDDLCHLFPKDFLRIDCVRSGKLMSIDQVEDMVWHTVQPLLPKLPKKKIIKAAKAEEKPSVSEQPANPYITKTDSGWDITDAGKQFLEEAVTESKGDVYAFSD